ncbi:MAG: hypothetical protein JXR37_09160 [Kiritimatiellae bacterium]|nr:hypothetical protein [Kiritimatiellia bacterium]
MIECLTSEWNRETGRYRGILLRNNCRGNNGKDWQLVARTRREFDTAAEAAGIMEAAVRRKPWERKETAR